jgi:hypothetical protein
MLHFITELSLNFGFTVRSSEIPLSFPNFLLIRNNQNTNQDNKLRQSNNITAVQKQQTIDSYSFPLTHTENRFIKDSITPIAMHSPIPSQ